MRLLPGFLSLAFMLGAAAAPPAFRLPDLARPTRYELELTIIPSHEEFRGTARIDVSVLRKTREIWLNSKDLRIVDASAEASGSALQVRATAHDEFLELNFHRDLDPRRPLHLVLRYTGNLSDKSNEGLYRKRAGEDWYAYTTFTPIEARRAFPCFDEPAYKARWKLILHVPEADVAASNTPVEKEIRENSSQKRVEFFETKPISSEVVAFAVGPFDVVEAGVAGANRVPVRILAPQGRGREAEGARDATARILARLEQYTGIPYPWQKLDHLAVLDMPYGAVENPGLITYRDRVLLAAPESDTPDHRHLLRGTMAHELAHQWFGNLVTQAWWDDVWLSEGFATWLGTKVADLELPIFERGLAGIVSRDQIMKADRGKDTRPVRLPIASREDMNRVYGRIVYQKGGAILRMVEHWVGEDPFRRALQKYLRDHALSNATTADLAAAIHEVAGVDAGPVLKSYLDQTGYPEIRATVNCSDPSRAGLAFQASGNWTTPVCFHATTGVRGCLVVGPSSAATVSSGTCPAWIWPNRDGYGYFRVRLSALDLQTMIRTGWEEMPATERVSVVEDAAELVVEGKLTAGDVVAILPTVARDNSPAIVNAGLRFLLWAIATAPPEDRAKYDPVVKQILSGR